MPMLKGSAQKIRATSFSFFSFEPLIIFESAKAKYPVEAVSHSLLCRIPPYTFDIPGYKYKTIVSYIYLRLVTVFSRTLRSIKTHFFAKGLNSVCFSFYSRFKFGYKKVFGFLKY